MDYIQPSHVPNEPAPFMTTMDMTGMQCPQRAKNWTNDSRENRSEHPYTAKSSGLRPTDKITLQFPRDCARNDTTRGKYSSHDIISRSNCGFQTVESSQGIAWAVNGNGEAKSNGNERVSSITPATEWASSFEEEDQEEELSPHLLGGWDTELLNLDLDVPEGSYDAHTNIPGMERSSNDSIKSIARATIASGTADMEDSSIPHEVLLRGTDTDQLMKEEELQNAKVLVNENSLQQKNAALQHPNKIRKFSPGENSSGAFHNLSAVGTEISCDNKNTQKEKVEFQRKVHDNEKEERVPELQIVSPELNDVLCERGGSDHHGTKFYKKLVKESLRGYTPQHASDREFLRRKITDYTPKNQRANTLLYKSIMETVHQCGGRFLARDKSNSELWHEISDKRAREKISQSLRDHVKRIKRTSTNEKDYGNSLKNRFKLGRGWLRNNEGATASESSCTTDSSQTTASVSPPSFLSTNESNSFEENIALAGVDFSATMMKQSWMENIAMRQRNINAQLKSLWGYTDDEAPDPSLLNIEHHHGPTERAVVKLKEEDYTFKCEIDLRHGLTARERTKVKRYCSLIKGLLLESGVEESKVNKIVLCSLWNGSIDLFLEAPLGVFDKLFFLLMQADMRIKLEKDLYLLAVAPAFTIKPVSHSIGKQLHGYLKRQKVLVDDDGADLRLWRQDSLTLLVPASLAASRKLVKSGEHCFHGHGSDGWEELLSVRRCATGLKKALSLPAVASAVFAALKEHYWKTETRSSVVEAKRATAFVAANIGSLST